MIEAILPSMSGENKRFTLDFSDAFLALSILIDHLSLLFVKLIFASDFVINASNQCHLLTSLRRASNP